MKVILAHNHYRQPGGEDQVFEGEASLLEQNGHLVTRIEEHNNSIGGSGQISLAFAAMWSRDSYSNLRETIRKVGAEIVHVHNTLPILSPSIYWAAAAEKTPVVQTVHNYRLLCPSGILYRDGHICEDCVGKKLPVDSVLHGCYRGSRAASAIVAGTLSLHHALGTWTNKVGAYVALTEFAKRKLVEGGFPAKKIFVKPNFVAHRRNADTGREAHLLYVGRLSEEKGIGVLLEAWQRPGQSVPLRIVGDGPMSSAVRTLAANKPEVEYLGARPHHDVMAEMSRARGLLFPSVWYEGLPMVIIEAFASGLPVIAADAGSMSSIIESGRTGLLYVPGVAADLASQAQKLVDSELANRMGEEARREYERRYTPESNYKQLMNIYLSCLDRGADTGCP